MDAQGGIVVLTWCEDRDSHRGTGSTDVERYDDPPFSWPLLPEFAFLEWRFTKRAHARCLEFAREGKTKAAMEGGVKLRLAEI